MPSTSRQVGMRLPAAGVVLVTAMALVALCTSGSSANAAGTARDDVTATANGTITGTITDSGTGSPIVGAWVAAVSTTGGFTAGAVTNGSGVYSLSLPTGTYKVEIIDGAGLHDLEWYDNQNAGGFDTASALTVTSGGTVTANAALAPAGASGRIAGTITEDGTGTAITGAWVVALRSGGAIADSATTNATGTYSISGLTAGTYKLVVIDPTMAHSIELFYNNRSNFDTADGLAVTAGATATANVGLAAATAPVGVGTISGTITDSSTAAPISGAWAIAISSAGVVTRGGVADGSGHYSLSVPAGTYKVELLDSTGEHFLEWFDDHDITDFTGATAVTVGSGGSQNASGSLPPSGSSGTIAGTVTESGSGDPIANAWTLAVRESDGALASDVTDSSGAYSIGGLEAGSYHLAVLDPILDHDIELFYDDKADFSTGDDIAVTAGHTATINADLDSPLPADVAVAGGRLLIPGQNVGDVDLTRLPVGDTHVSTTTHAVGNLYLCSTVGGGGGGAPTQGPWFNGDGTWNLVSKVAVLGSVTWPTATFSTSVSGSTRSLAGNNLPTNHVTGTFPIATSDPAHQYDANPASIVAHTYSVSIPANPTAASTPGCVGGEAGFLLSGVILNSPVDALKRDAVAWEEQDPCEGHPNGGVGYHYHSVSPCVPDTGTGHSDLVGYALDGYGIYGHRGEGGEVLTNADLDECHGHTHTITWNGQSVSMYHYHATWEFPYAVGCFHGTNSFRGPPF